MNLEVKICVKICIIRGLSSLNIFIILAEESFVSITRSENSRSAKSEG